MLRQAPNITDHLLYASLTTSFIWQSSSKYLKRRFLPQRKHTHLQCTKRHTRHLRLFCGKMRNEPDK